MAEVRSTQKNDNPGLLKHVHNRLLSHIEIIL